MEGYVSAEGISVLAVLSPLDLTTSNCPLCCLFRSHQFLEQASNDLAAYAEHAGRRTIDESDVELLMDRLRLTNDKVSLESLLHRYLPRELRDKVLFPDEMQRFRRS